MTDSEIKVLEDFTGYHFRGDSTPEELNSGKVAIKYGDMFRIKGADEFVELQAGHLYVRNGMIVRFGYSYFCGEGFFIVADCPCDTIRFEDYLDNKGKQLKLRKEIRVPIGVFKDDLLHYVIKELNKA